MEKHVEPSPDFLFFAVSAAFTIQAISNDFRRNPSAVCLFFAMMVEMSRAPVRRPRQLAPGHETGSLFRQADTETDSQTKPSKRRLLAKKPSSRHDNGFELGWGQSSG